MCEQARCTSPTEAHGLAGIRCLASSARMVAEGFLGEGDDPFFSPKLCQVHYIPVQYLSVCHHLSSALMKCQMIVSPHKANHNRL